MSDDDPWPRTASRLEISPRKENHLKLVGSHEPAARRHVGWSLLRAWLAIDGLLGVSLLVYSILVLHSSSSASVWVAIALSLLAGTLLTLRSACGLVGLRLPQFCIWGLSLGVSYLSPLLALVLLILSILSGSLHAKVFGYLERHADALHLSQRLLTFLDHHHHALWVTLLVLLGLEILRWLLTRQLILQEMEDEEMRSLRRPRLESRHRPWWWSKSKTDVQSSDLEDPLLFDSSQPYWSSGHHSRSYVIQDGVLDTTHDSIWSRLRATLGVADKDASPRDDGSVDFASVQEEWASRSQEDPLWWSRDEEAQDD